MCFGEQSGSVKMHEKDLEAVCCDWVMRDYDKRLDL